LATNFLRAAAITLSLLGAAGLAAAQPLTPPHPDQAGADTSMAVPQPVPGQPDSDQVKVMPSGFNPAEFTPGLPSARKDAAQFNPGVWERDKQPVLAWTLGLSDKQRSAMLQTIMGDSAATIVSGGNANAAKVEGVTPAIGEVVPDSVELYPLPASVTAQMPNAQPYKLARIGNDLVLVDPNNHAIVAVLKP
jgi:hypothetical protein